MRVRSGATACSAKKPTCSASALAVTAVSPLGCSAGRRPSFARGRVAFVHVAARDVVGSVWASSVELRPTRAPRSAHHKRASTTPNSLRGSADLAPQLLQTRVRATRPSRSQGKRVLTIGACADDGATERCQHGRGTKRRADDSVHPHQLPGLRSDRVRDRRFGGFSGSGSAGRHAPLCLGLDRAGGRLRTCG